MAPSRSAATLDPLLCFAVYTLDRQIGRIYQELLSPWKLSYTQYLVLLLLSEGGPALSVRELGESLDLDSGTLSPLLRRLESRGLVTRSRTSEDGRVVQVSLTEAGRTVRNELDEVQRCLLDRVPLDPQEAQELHQRVRAASARLAAV